MEEFDANQYEATDNCAGAVISRRTMARIE